MKKLAYLIILVGAAFFVYPTGKHLYEDYRQQQLLQSWTAKGAPPFASSADGNSLQTENNLLKDSLAVGEAGSFADPAQQAGQSLEQQGTAVNGNVPVPDKGRPLSQVQKLSTSKAGDPNGSGNGNPGVWALLQIDRISSKLPVLQGVSMQNMKYAAAHMSGTAKPGEIGNSVIAAHRSYSYGRLFNRLDELSLGDEVKLAYGGQSYTYRVTGKKTVAPDDLSVLNKDGKRKLLTLITCDETGKDRVIVQAELTQ